MKQMEKHLDLEAKKNEELEELYMVIGSLRLMADGLKKSGTYCHAEKAKAYETLAAKYDARFLALHSNLGLAASGAKQ